MNYNYLIFPNNNGKIIYKNIIKNHKFHVFIIYLEYFTRL